jgi:hypothetical protein
MWPTDRVTVLPGSCGGLQVRECQTVGQRKGWAVPQPVEIVDMAVNFEGLIQLLARHLYSSPEVFVRERFSQ